MDSNIVVLTGHNYSMITNDILFNIAAIVGIISITFVVVAYRSKRMTPLNKCGCGKSESGYCDNSHSAEIKDDKSTHN